MKNNMPSYKTASGNMLMIIITVTIILVASVSGGYYAWKNNSSKVMLIQEADKFNVIKRTFQVTLKEKGELKAAKSKEIINEVEGRATIIWLIDEGSEVKSGDLLVELNSDEIDNKIIQEELSEARSLADYETARTELEIQIDQNASDIAKAVTDVEIATLELDKYEKGEWIQQYRDAEIAIEEAQTTMERREEDYQASIKLREAEYITEAELKEDKFKWEQAKWNLEKAENNKVLLEQYTHVATLKQKRSDLEEKIQELARIRKNADAQKARKEQALESRRRELELVRTNLTKYREQKDKCKLYANGPGFVVYGSPKERNYWGGGDEEIKKGATVYERQVLITIPDTNRMVVQTKVHEAKMDRLRIGQTARVEVEGIPDKSFDGSVTKIAPLASSGSRWVNPELREYETEISISESGLDLKPGQTAYAEIFVDQITEEIAIPKQAIYSKMGKQFVFCIKNNDVSPKEVKLGRSNTSWVEVMNGLNENEKVLLAFNDEHIRLLPELSPDDIEKKQTFDPSSLKKGQKANFNKQNAGKRGKPTKEQIEKYKKMRGMKKS